MGAKTSVAESVGFVLFHMGLLHPCDEFEINMFFAINHTLQVARIKCLGGLRQQNVSISPRFLS